MKGVSSKQTGKAKDKLHVDYSDSSLIIEGSIRVPYGHIVVSGRWRNTDLVDNLQSSIPVHFEDNLGVVDFYPSNYTGIIYISESDLISSTGYRRKLAKLRKANKVRGVVITEKTSISDQYLLDLQKFANLELGLVLLYVENELEAAKLLIQMVNIQGHNRNVSFPQLLLKDILLPELLATHTYQTIIKEAPMDFQKRMPKFKVHVETRNESNPIMKKSKQLNNDEAILNTLICVPKLGDVKAKLILQKFKSLREICNASVESLGEIVGVACAKNIKSFFGVT